MPANPIAVVLVATGREEFIQFVEPAIAALKRFFPPHDVVLFTDSDKTFDAIKIYHPVTGWPRITLMRYHMMLEQEELLSKYEYIFYIDVDMLVVRKIEASEICGDGLTAVTHPGFPDAFERRAASTARINGNPTYYQGCFIGGKTIAFLSMAHVIKNNIDVDDANNIMAVWLDESHLNRYLQEHPPAIELSPAWCWPGDDYLSFASRWKNPPDVRNFVPVIRHLEKMDQSWKWATHERTV